MTVVEVVMMFGACIALAIALGQWFIKNQRPTNRWLCLLTFSCAVWIVLAVCHQLNLFLQYPHLNKTHVPFLAITGPLWYKYIHSLHETNSESSFRYHLIIPFTVSFVLSLPFYLESGVFKSHYIETQLDNFASVLMYAATRYAEITGIVYCTLSIFYLKNLKQESSKQKSIQTIHILLMLSVLALLAVTTRFYGSVFEAESASVAIPTMMVAGVLLVLFLLGHRKPVVLGLDRSESHIKVVTNKDVLTLEQCRSQLITGQWYLDPDLKLQKLARKLEIPPNRLSELINNAEGVNFNEFVNELRIKHAQTLMAEDSRISNDDVANLSGFNSRSVFYRKFKQNTGTTPAEFRKKKVHAAVNMHE